MKAAINLRVCTLIILLATGVSPILRPAPVETLCILDFQRLGDDARSDWLEQGLADMMIHTMSSLSPYLVIERKHLKEMLRERGLAGSGFVDTAMAARQARLAGAQLLLEGSFARQGDQLTVQVRLIRVPDQQVLARVTWTDGYGEILAAPRSLSGLLLASLGNPLNPGALEGIEKQIPSTIDVAETYYQGVRAFDDGRYSEALAFYLDASRQAGEFRRAHPAVLEMYYLLGWSEHAVLFARDLARSYEARGAVGGALTYYFAAAQECLDTLKDERSGIGLLEKLMQLVERHEKSTGEIARTKQSILNRIDALLATGKQEEFGKVLADRDIRHQMWAGEIEAEIVRRSEEQARGGYAVLEDGKWIRRPVPEPSVLMWKTRGRLALARAYARSGQIKPALDQYRELLREFEFLARHKLYDGKSADAIKTEAQFMLLRHYGETGVLVRDHAMNRINSLNPVANGLVFTRDFREPGPDPRARVTSRYENRGHEYFDFAALAGHRLDSLTLRIQVDGPAEFAVYLPHSAGFPPQQFSFSKRLENLQFPNAGTYERRLVPPTGTEFVSISTLWGARRPVRWEASFTVSPMRKVISGPHPSPLTPLAPVVQKLVDRYAAGWDRSYVVRDGQTTVYSGNPRLDAYAEEWLVYSMDGNIRIFQQRDPRVELRLPVAINSREREVEPSLVRAADGRYALLWARGTSNGNASRFVAFSKDLLDWETPQRLIFEQPSGKINYEYSEPLERTYNVVAVRQGYAMLLAQGFMRYSKDLRNWGPPRKAIAQDLLRNRLLKGDDGVIWAVYENSSSERQPYTPADWLHGYFVVDGKPYRHVTELRVSRSPDGMTWEAAGKVVLPGQPSGLWAFPVGERQIGVAVGFNNLSATWFAVPSLGELRQIDSSLQLMHPSEEAQCFVRDASLICIRPVMDFEKQKPMLLATSTERLWGGAR